MVDLTANEHTANGSPLGKETGYPCHYAPELLYSIPRKANREALGISSELPFFGEDLWTAYEMSWLNGSGKPLVAIAELALPATSENIIESKSLKLYFNSFNQTRFNSMEQVRATIGRDLGDAAGQPVAISLISVEHAGNPGGDSHGGYTCIDGLDIEVNDYQLSTSTLQVDSNDIATEKLASHLLKSNCPVTGQPDWASVYIDYTGPRIHHEGLLRYLIGYREHQEFHEQCVERMFIDLMALGLERLTINARYVRRGGLDINPVRSTHADYPVIQRTVRQ